MSIADYHTRELTEEETSSILGELAFDDLIGSDLFDGRLFMRRNAALALMLLQSREIDLERSRLLAVATRDLDPLVREHSLRAIGKQKTAIEPAIEAILRALADAAESITLAARDGLDRLAERAGDAVIPDLIRALFDPRPSVRLAVADVLAARGVAAAGPLVEALRIPEVPVRTVVTGILMRLGVHAARALIAALTDSTLRPLAQRLLIKLSSVDDESKGALQIVAESDDPEARDAARDLLLRLGAEVWQAEVNAAASLPKIDIEGWGERALSSAELDAAAKGPLKTGIFLRSLRDGRNPARANAIGVVARRARGDASLAGSLVYGIAAMVRDHADEVRSAAADTLVAIGDEAAVEPLLGALLDRWPAVVQTARETLQRLGPKAAAAILDSLAIGQPGPLHAAAIEILRGYGADAAPALATGLEHHGAPTARAAAAAALEVMGADAAAAIPALIVALRDPSVEVGAAAARALAGIAQPTEAVLTALNGARRDGATLVRRAATQAILRLVPEAIPVSPPPIQLEGFEDQPLAPGDVGEPARRIPVDSLTHALSDGRPMVRHNAAVILGARGANAFATAPLARALRDPEVRVRRAAAEALATVVAGDDALFAVRGLADTLLDPQRAVGEAAGRALTALGETALPGLVAALDRDPALAAVTVVPPLAAQGAAAVAPLTKALADPSVRVRANAAAALAGMGKGVAETARAPLVAAAKENGVVRTQARLALDALDGILPPPRSLAAEPIPFDGFEERVLEPAELGAAAKKLGVAALVAASRDGREVVRRNATAALGAAKGEGLTAALAGSLRDPDVEVRRAAAAAFGRAVGGDDPRNAVLALTDAMIDVDRVVRDNAAESLRALGAGALPGLMIALDRDPALAEHTVLPIFAGPEPVGPLVEALQHNSVRVRANAASALATIGPPFAEPARAALKVSHHDPHEMVRLAARWALDRLDGRDKKEPPAPVEPIPVAGFEERPLSPEEIGDVVTTDRLIRALDDGRAVVRRNAAVALGARGAAAAAPALALALKDIDPAVRIAAADALSKTGGGGAGALADAILDADPKTAQAAFGTLQALGERALEGLVAALDREPGRAAFTVVPALAALGKKAAEALIPALEHPSVWTRANAAKALARIGKGPGEPARAALTTASRDVVGMVRLAARRAIDALDGIIPAPRFEEAEPPPMEGFDTAPLPLDVLRKHEGVLAAAQLRRLIFDGRQPVRENAARALQLVARREEGPGELLLALKDIDPGVRAAAAESLAALKLDAERVVPALAAVLTDSSGRVRDNAVKAIAAYGDAAVRPLVALLARPTDIVLQTLAVAARALPALLVPPLTQKLTPREKDAVRENAVTVLGELGAAGRSAAKPLMEAIRDIEVPFRVKVLVPPPAPFRAKAIRALASIALLDADVRALLLRVQDTDHRLVVQDAITEALKKLDEATAA